MKYLLLMMVSLSVMASEYKPDVLKALNLAFVQEKENFKVEYCPDNTCDTFIYNVNDEEKLEIYLILFFYYQSGYVYLEQWKENADVQKRVNLIEASYGKNAKEIKKMLEHQLDIHYYFTRYDEKKHTRADR